MTIVEALKKSFHSLQSITPSAALDGEVLLAFVVGKPRVFLYAHPEKTLSTKHARRFLSLVARRKKHEPLSYLTGERWFYGLDFSINKNVLIPRPETELLVDLAKEAAMNIPKKNHFALLDIGTGSGCIPIALRKNVARKNCIFLATDASTQALSLAKKNAKKLGVAKKISFLKGDLLKPLFRNPLPKNTTHLIVTANLPYLATEQWKNAPAEVKDYEPRMALDGGRHGMKYYKKLLRQMKKLLRRSPVNVQAFFEIDPDQTILMQKLVKKHFPTAKISIHRDLCKFNRVISFSPPPLL